MKTLTRYVVSRRWHLATLAGRAFPVTTSLPLGSGVRGPGSGVPFVHGVGEKQDPPTSPLGVPYRDPGPRTPDPGPSL